MNLVEAALQSEELRWESLELERSDYLVRPGQKEHYTYYVEKGALRAFVYVEEEEYTIRLAYQGSTIAALPTYFTGEPSRLYIQAIRKCHIKQIGRTAFEHYLKKEPERIMAYNELLKDLVGSFYEREIDLLTSSPAERLQRLIQRSPQVLQEIPHKYIASYLRMSAETLSRILK